MFRVSKNQIIFGGNYYGLEGGYLVWDKLNGNSDQYDCELAWLSFTKRTDLVYYMWSGMIQGECASRDVRKALRQIGNKRLNEKRIHETQKPIKLYDWIINEYKIKGNVFDSHLGSGSNRIASGYSSLIMPSSSAVAISILSKFSLEDIKSNPAGEFKYPGSGLIVSLIPGTLPCRD